MHSNTKVEMLFDDIRGYIDSLEKGIKSKEKEIEIRDRKIKILEEKTTISFNKSIDSENEDFINIDKSLLDIKSIYYLIINSSKTKNNDMIKSLFDILKKEDIQNMSEKSNVILVNALCIYSMYDFTEKIKKGYFISKCLEKLNPDKLSGIYRKIYTQLILDYEMQNYIDEDFLVKFLRNTAFSNDKDIAKNIIMRIIDGGRVINGESNIQNIMLIGLYLGVEKVRKISYIEKMYIEAMNSRYDNLFINYLIGKIKLDYSLIPGNIGSIKILNKNLVSYIYKIANENKQKINNKLDFIENKSSKEDKNIVKKVQTISTGTLVENSDEKSEKIIALKSICLNKNTRSCDLDGGELKIIPSRISYYNSKNEIIGNTLENVSICKICKRKTINTDIVRKIYRKISKDCHIKFKNDGKINLSMFKYNIGLSRSERFELLKEVICPALGVSEVINQLHHLIEIHKKDEKSDYTMSIIEWEHDKNRIVKSFGIQI